MIVTQEDIANHFNQDELIQIFQGLIQKKSENPPGNEKGAAFYVRDILEQHGIKTEFSWATSERPNVIASLKGLKPGPTMLYNGHLDVVPAGSNWSVDPYKGIIQNGRMYGRGTADMKSGVSAMVYAAIVLNRLGNPFAGELILFFNVDEESVNIGMEKFLTENISADYAVISEPTDLNVCIAHKGVGRYRLRTNGVPGHAAAVSQPDSAIYKMAKVILALEEHAKHLKKRINPIVGSASLVVTQINGGTAPNIIPGLCEIEIDRRLLPGETKEDVYNEIWNVTDKIAKEYSFQYELDCYLFLPASFIDEESHLVKGTLSVSNSLKRQSSKVKVFNATCEAPFFSVRKGIPTVIFGPGSLEQAHINDEYVEIKKVVDASRIFINLAMHMLRG